MRRLAALVVTAIGCGRIGFEPSSAGGDGGSAPGSLLTLDRVRPPETLGEFPLLVVLDDVRADRTKILPDASNVRFYDATGALLAHEIEQPGKVGGPPLLAWVFVPTIAGSNTTLRVTYGSAPERARPASWPAPYTAVWHLDGTGTASDSAGMMTAVATGTDPAIGMIGGGRHFIRARQDVLTVADTAAYAPTAFTLSGWVKPASSPGGFYGMATRQVGDTSDNDLYLGFVASGAAITCETGSGESDVFAGSGLALGNWMHVVGSVTGSAGLLKVYVDGVMKMQLGIPTTGLTSNARPIFLGADRSGAGGSPLVADSDFLDGDLDEMRVETVERSAAWIAYDDQAQRDQVITYGPVE